MDFLINILTIWDPLAAYVCTQLPWASSLLFFKCIIPFHDFESTENNAANKGAALANGWQVDQILIL